MSFVPPGIAHLAYGLPQFFLNAAITSAGLHVLSREAAFKAPIWLYVVSGITGNVLVVVARYVYTEYRAKQDSKAFDAILAPQVQESSARMLKKLDDRQSYLGVFLHISLIYPLTAYFKPIGEALRQWSIKYGNTYRFSIYGDLRVGFINRRGWDILHSCCKLDVYNGTGAYQGMNLV
jgi:hypothetical protein